MAGGTNGEEVVAHNIVLAFLQIIVVIDKTENPAAHEYVWVDIVIRLDLFEAFIQPVNTISAVDHFDFSGLITPDYCWSEAGTGVIPTSSANSFLVCRAAKSASFFAYTRLSSFSSTAFRRLSSDAARSPFMAWDAATE